MSRCATASVAGCGVGIGICTGCSRPGLRIVDRGQLGLLANLRDPVDRAQPHIGEDSVRAVTTASGRINGSLFDMIPRSLFNGTRRARYPETGSFTPIDARKTPPGPRITTGSVRAPPRGDRIDRGSNRACTGRREYRFAGMRQRVDPEHISIPQEMNVNP